jgi:hypothetical protein
VQYDEHALAMALQQLESIGRVKHPSFNLRSLSFTRPNGSNRSGAASSSWRYMERVS